MYNFSLVELWNLRAELDDAVLRHNYDKIKTIKEKYKTLVENGRCLITAFYCYNQAFCNLNNRNNHYYANVFCILDNIQNYEDFYLNCKKASLKIKLPSSASFLASDIWTLRAMFDKFIVKASCKDEQDIQNNMILGKAIIGKLDQLLHNNDLDIWSEDISTIKNEVVKEYSEIYGTNRPKLGYAELSQEFMEK